MKKILFYSDENGQTKVEVILQDKKFVSDFDKLLIETERLENH